MALFNDWQAFAEEKSSAPDAQQYWNDYFLRERDFYIELLKSEPITGTVKALAERFGVTEQFMKKAVCLYVHGNPSAELYF